MRTLFGVVLPTFTKMVSRSLPGHVDFMLTDLGIAYATVNKHISNVYGKLRVHSASAAVALAIRKGPA